MADALERALDEGTGSVPRPGHALPPGLPERLDEGQAAALWRRAAQLQADALRRLDERDLRVTRASLGSGQVASSESDAANAAAPGYRLVDVAASAEEAGISRQYIALALAELPRGALPTAASLGIGERTATRFLGTDVRSIAVTVEIPAPPPRASTRSARCSASLRMSLELRETVGEHPLDGGVLVFDLPGPIVGVLRSRQAESTSTGWLRTSGWKHAGAGHAEGASGQCGPHRVTMTADLRPGVRRNVRVSQWLAGIAGSGTGFLTGAFIAKGRRGGQRGGARTRRRRCRMVAGLTSATAGCTREPFSRRRGMRRVFEAARQRHQVGSGIRTHHATICPAPIVRHGGDGAARRGWRMTALRRRARQFILHG